MLTNTIEDDGYQAIYLRTPLRLTKNFTCLQQQLKIAQIAVA